MRFAGFLIGGFTFVIIGILHPIIIKAEYYIGVKCWWCFLTSGIGCVIFSFLLTNIIISSLLSILGFSLLWSIHELFAQRKRVKKGWFPTNPNKKLPKLYFREERE